MGQSSQKNGCLSDDKKQTTLHALLHFCVHIRPSPLPPLPPTCLFLLPIAATHDRRWLLVRSFVPLPHPRAERVCTYSTLSFYSYSWSEKKGNSFSSPHPSPPYFKPPRAERGKTDGQKRRRRRALSQPLPSSLRPSFRRKASLLSVSVKAGGRREASLWIKHTHTQHNHSFSYLLLLPK